MKRKKFSPELKKRIAVAAIREQQSINEIASAHEVHPVQVRKWKKELLDGAISIFESPKKRETESKHVCQQEGELQKKIGQLTMENDWLKKKLSP